jgi:hypothetical protein
VVSYAGGSVSTRAKEDESSTGHVWAAIFHHVTARFRVARVLKLAKSISVLVCSFLLLIIISVLFAVTSLSVCLSVLLDYTTL